MTERDQVRFGATTIAYTIVRSHRRRKTIGITLDPRQGVLVVAPVDVPAEQIRAVVAKRAGWILQRTTAAAAQRRPKEFVSGESLPYLGQQMRLFVEHASVRQLSLTFDQSSFHLVVPALLAGEERRAAIQRLLTRWYGLRAMERLAERVARWAGVAGLAPAAVLIRNQRQRWGSCGPDGTLRFNWRIILAPPALIDYVVVHELAHLRVRNHSPLFWAEVARLMPDYQLRRARLKEIGPSLTIEGASW